MGTTTTPPMAADQTKTTPGRFPKIIDGMRFGKLTVIRNSGSKEFPSGAIKKMMVVSCSCGSPEKEIQRGNLITGGTTSCGCDHEHGIVAIRAAHKLNPKTHLVHGFRSRTAGNRLYPIWSNIKKRCTDPKFWCYHRYGGRGIRLCEQWMHDPAAFVRYIEVVLGPQPTPKHTIDRSNNDGNYEPGNLRWATRAEQSRNRAPSSQWKKPTRKEK